MTALHLVGLYKSSAPVVKALIKAGAEVDALDGHQCSPLHWAAMYNPAAVQVLVQANAKVNVLDKWNWSPLIWLLVTITLRQLSAYARLGQTHTWAIVRTSPLCGISILVLCQPTK